MKRKILLVVFLLIAVCLILTGCQNKVVEEKTTSGNGANTSSNVTNTKSNVTKSDSSESLSYSINGKEIKVKVEANNLDYDKLPWVGLVPVGNYKDEEAADEVDVTYTYVTKENYPNVILDIDGVEPGNWLIILCDTDDEGKVLATSPITIK